MPMARMTPETYNGKEILRPVTAHSDGIPKLASSAVFHPPSIIVEPHHVPLGALIEAEAQSIVGMKAMTTSELRERLHGFALRVIANERTRNSG